MCHKLWAFSSQNPVLPSLVKQFLWKKAPKTTNKKQGFFIPTEPQKFLEKKGKRSKNQEFLAGEKDKEFQQNKERKDRAISANKKPSSVK